MEWVKCSERMPDVGDKNWRTPFPVLVNCEIGVIPAYYGSLWHDGKKHVGFMESIRYGNGNGDFPDEEESELMKHVTHWMPLPEPPSE